MNKSGYRLGEDLGDGRNCPTIPSGAVWVGDVASLLWQLISILMLIYYLLEAVLDEACRRYRHREVAWSVCLLYDCVYGSGLFAWQTSAVRSIVHSAEILPQSRLLLRRTLLATLLPQRYT